MSNPPTLLYVEDSIENQMLIHFYIKKLNINLVCKESAKAAISYLENNSPDLVIIDLNLPGELDSVDVLNYLNQNSSLNNIPVMIMSAMTIAEIDQRVKQFIIKEYLIKPVMKAEFIEKLKTVFPSINS